MRANGSSRPGAKLIRATLAAIVICSTLFVAQAQTRFMHLNGQVVSPAYEGWWPNEDGSYKLFFGYMNSNWEEELDIPIGPNNYFTFNTAAALDDLAIDAYDFAVADQGQATHFYPRRNPFLFTVDVPANIGTGELVWTLKSQGQTLRAYGSLKSDYLIDPQVISTEVGGNFGSLDDRLRSNIPPDLRVEGESYRQVRTGQALNLAVFANDPDNYPPRSGRRLPQSLDQLYNPPSSIVASSPAGLRFSWSVYRGPARHVVFDPVQLKTWTDTRAWGNSAWSPPWILPEVPADNRWITEASFSQPGEYVLRGIASDGSIFSYQNVYVTVTE